MFIKLINIIVKIILASGFILNLDSAYGYTPDYNFTFGPFLGSGNMSTGASVRQANGVRASLDRRYDLNSKWSLGPKIEVGYGVTDASSESHGRKAVLTYDHRFFLIGARLGKSILTDKNFAHQIYFSAGGGAGFSKLNQDESAENVYIRKDLSNILGPFYSAELGGLYSLKKDLSLNLSFLYQHYVADQRKAKGSVEGDRKSSEARLGLTGAEEQNFKSELDDHVTFKNFALQFGISLGY